MTISAPMSQTMSRINEIRTRFEPPVRARSDATAATGAFSSVLATRLDRSAASSDPTVLDQPSIDLSTMGGDSLDGLGNLASSSSYANALSSLRRVDSASTGGAVTGDAVVADAKRYLGVPYQWGGTDPAKGLDCSGFVQRAYGDLGIDLPRVSRDQAKVGTEVASLADARPGDLIAFGQPVDHIAIYVGDGKIIQAPHTGDVVKISDIKRPITTIRRVLADTATTAGTPAAARAVTATARYGASVAYSSGTPRSASDIQGQARYQSLFDAAGAKYGISPALLASVARAESNFDPNARSSAGAVGLMQFMPATAAGLGIDPSDPAQAIDGAARYLATQIRTFGSVELAVAAYNAGPGNVRKYGGVPPFAETRNYVTKVMGGIEPALAASGKAY